MTRGAFLIAAFALAATACAAEVAAPNADGSPLCVSGTYWTRGDHGDNAMHPGRACIRCHAERRRGPAFTVAGTIFNAPHEEDECNGNAGSPVGGQKTWIEIIDADGRALVIEPNNAGNFYTTLPLRAPLRRARVVSPSGHFVQMDAPPSGDCNACHTREGANGSPGRVVAPNNGI